MEYEDQMIADSGDKAESNTRKTVEDMSYYLGHGELGFLKPLFNRIEQLEARINYLEKMINQQLEVRVTHLEQRINHD